MTADPETRLRADARRNREQIIAAAKKVFLELGPDVPMEEIARRAGVGVGTLYRRFPDREALILAVARHNFTLVLAEARAVVSEGPTAWDALVRLLSRSIELRLTVQLSLLSPTAYQIIHDDEKTHEFREQLLAVLDELVKAAQAEGSMRDDIGAGDVAVLFSLLLHRMHLRGPDLMLDRARALIIDALRTGPHDRLPGHPIGPADLQRS